ncbi:hypothetical protein [Methylocella silvestris]|nr:hypothetical protein [Methylocella silvestris]
MELEQMGVVLRLSQKGQLPECAETLAPFWGAESSSDRRQPLRNAPLHCLAGGNLAGRFHKWRAASGRSYIFSVFPVSAAHDFDDSDLGGLPAFESAVVLAMGFNAVGQRRRLGAFELCCSGGASADASETVAALIRLGAREWHVHLLAEGSKARRALLADLTD